MDTETRAPNRSLKDAPLLVRATRRLEDNTAIDQLSALLAPAAGALLASKRRADLLHGSWLGHALHPLLTDLPIGSWTSAMLLDVAGGRQSRPAAQRLVGAGLLAALPTMATGLAEWGDTTGGDRRVGAVHAVANSAALGLYAGSFLARRRGQHLRGALLALIGGGALAAGGYLGGHLVSARKVSSRDPVYAATDAAC
ncbi:MAG: DUF2231 domain-containing protein [Nocardioidaceae bacterium]